MPSSASFSIILDQKPALVHRNGFQRLKISSSAFVSIPMDPKPFGSIQMDSDSFGESFTGLKRLSAAPCRAATPLTRRRRHCPGQASSWRIRDPGDLNQRSKADAVQFSLHWRHF